MSRTSLVSNRHYPLREVSPPVSRSRWILPERVSRVLLARLACTWTLTTWQVRQETFWRGSSSDDCGIFGLKPWNLQVLPLLTLRTPEHGLFWCCHRPWQLQPRHEVPSPSSAWGLAVVAGHQPRLGCRSSASLDDTGRGAGKRWKTTDTAERGRVHSDGLWACRYSRRTHRVGWQRLCWCLCEACRTET